MKKETAYTILSVVVIFAVMGVIACGGVYIFTHYIHTMLQLLVLALVECVVSVAVLSAIEQSGVIEKLVKPLDGKE
jgi:uncharacterized membrane protein